MVCENTRPAGPNNVGFESRWELRKDVNGNSVPIVTLRCGHRMCLPCAQGVWKHKKECPYCYTKMQLNDILPLAEQQNVEHGTEVVEAVEEIVEVVEGDVENDDEI